MTLPTYIPLDEASRRTGWTVERLRTMVETGTIMAGKLPDGDIIVAVEEGKVIETPAPVETPAETVAAETEEARPKPERALPLAVAGDDINAQLAAIKREDYEHLRGVPITVTEAAREYETNRTTIFAWVQKGYIDIIKPGYGMLLDKADVAYCVAVHRVRKKFGVRAPLLQDDGTPYLLKYPDLSLGRKTRKS